jgi:hypothetical protein
MSDATDAAIIRSIQIQDNQNPSVTCPVPALPTNHDGAQSYRMPGWKEFLLRISNQTPQP